LKIDKPVVNHIAALAKLKIRDQELDKWIEHMTGIIGFADRLNELDLKDYDESTENLTVYNVFREDETKPSYPRDVILSNAPDSDEGCYVVPKIVE